MHVIGTLLSPPVPTHMAIKQRVLCFRCTQVVPKLRESVNLWREFAPVVQYLSNPDLKDRHWNKINDATKARIERGEKLTLRVLMDMKVRNGACPPVCSAAGGVDWMLL